MVNPCTESSLGVGVILAITFLAICLVFAGLLAWIFFRKWRASKLILHATNEIIKLLEEGTGTGDKTSELSYDDGNSYELSEDSFHIDKSVILGRGQIGVVFKGKVYNYCKGDCAFKTTMNVNAANELKGLLTDLKTMMYIGPHDNIVKLIGTYTKEIRKGILYVATEFCIHGSLLSYLRTIQQDSIDDYQDFSIYGRTHTPLNKFMRWCEEIANGMDYLSFKRIIHMDLAARSILLGEGEIAKISDFKMSHQMHDDNVYVNRENVPMPWRWMAIESLRERIFSTQSDVWAYGITIWEIFSFGKVPYPGLGFTMEFVEMLEQGQRNEKSEYCSTEIYNVMRSCWNENSASRPEFSALRTFFTELRNEGFNEDIPYNSEGIYVPIGIM